MSKNDSPSNFLELFAGSGCMGKEAERLGMNVFSVDWTDYDDIDLLVDIGTLTKEQIPFVPDHVHASFDCTTYTVTAISTHRNGTAPKTEYAKKCDNVNQHVIALIKEWLEINPNMTFTFENPRGMLRKMPFMQEFTRHTVWYCKYGENRAKPTDIWTNLKSWTPRPECQKYKYDKEGNIIDRHCHHESARRGARTGTQGIKGSYDRSKIPVQLCKEIIESSLEHKSKYASEQQQNLNKMDEGINVLSFFDGMSCGQIALERAGIRVNKYYAAEVDKYAIKVAMANYPNTTQLGDVTNVFAKDLLRIDLLMGGSPCFTKGTKIICEHTFKDIDKVMVGDYVLTHNHRYRKVLRIGNDEKEIYKVITQGSIPTETTINHPYYIRKRKSIWNQKIGKTELVFSDPDWVKVGDIQKGDYVGTPILKTSKNILNLTEDECFLLGIYIGDGHTRKDFRVSENRGNDRHWQLIISVGEHEKDLFETNINLKYSFYKHSKSVYRAVFSSKRLVKIVEEHCGIGAENKYLSKTLLDLPVELLRKVLDGYEFADGSSRKNVYRATTISSKLIQTLSLAIAKVYRTTCCVEYTHRPAKTLIEGRVVNQKNTWTISYRKTHPKQSRAWVIDGVVWNPIKSVTKNSISDLVYNIEVEEDNSYVANNHIVHNCQGFSIAGKKLNFDDPRSKLFFEFVRVLNEIREINPNVLFLLENVRMKKEFQDIISKYLGVEPIEINSARVSAQSRKRLYWTNISQGPSGLFGDMITNIPQPKDKGIMLKDIIHETADNQLSEKELDYMLRSSGKWSPSTNNRFETYLNYPEKKAHCLTANLNKGVPYNCFFNVLSEYIVPFDKTLQILDREVQCGNIGYFRKDNQSNRVYYIHDKAVTLHGEGGVEITMTPSTTDNITTINPKKADGTQTYQQDRVYTTEGKMVCISAEIAGRNHVFVNDDHLFGCITPDRIKKRQKGQRFSNGKKFYTLLSKDRNGVLVEGYIRKLTPIECERLQTIPDNYSNHVSRTQRYKMIGNGWTVSVVAHILSYGEWS